MSETLTGGCLCGQLRYVVDGPPRFAGHCHCVDCRRASGSGFVPFMGVPASAFRVTGEARQHRGVAIHGGEAVRNFCPHCGGLVFGGIVGQDDLHTVYAGSLDDPSAFKPTIAIFLRDKPGWVIVPPGLTSYDTMPS